MKIAIVGGGGNMGRWFARFLVKEGMEVVISSREPEKLRATELPEKVGVASNEDAVRQADAVILSVPIDTFEKVVAEIAPCIQAGQVVVDITSVKTMPVTVMHRYLKNNPVLGTHPMFGPRVKGMTGMNVVLTPTNENERNLALRVQNFLVSRYARVSLMSPEAHDKMMTVVLGLSHFIGLITADTLKDISNLKEMAAIKGTTYGMLLSLVENVVSQDPELYSSIQMALDGLPELENQFLKTGASWAEIVKNKDKEGFKKKMTKLKDIRFMKDDL